MHVLNKQEDSAVEVAVLGLVTHFLTKIRLSSTNLYSRYSNMTFLEQYP